MLREETPETARLRRPSAEGMPDKSFFDAFRIPSRPPPPIEPPPSSRVNLSEGSGKNLFPLFRMTKADLHDCFSQTPRARTPRNSVTPLFRESLLDGTLCPEGLNRVRGRRTSFYTQFFYTIVEEKIEGKLSSFSLRIDR